MQAFLGSAPLDSTDTNWGANARHCGQSTAKAEFKLYKQGSKLPLEILQIPESTMITLTGQVKNRCPLLSHSSLGVYILHTYIRLCGTVHLQEFDQKHTHKRKNQRRRPLNQDGKKLGVHATEVKKKKKNKKTNKPGNANTFKVHKLHQRCIQNNNNNKK